MVTLKAVVQNSGDKYHLILDPGSTEISIPLSEDNSTVVKAAFNKLILRIKEGDFQIKLETKGEDLFTQVASEYVTQLNREIREVRGEMQQHGLVAR